MGQAQRQSENLIDSETLVYRKAKGSNIYMYLYQIQSCVGSTVVCWPFFSPLTERLGCGSNGVVQSPTRVFSGAS